uniref:Uncharacterized protein n=1 Tax=Podoviridae sp. ctsNK10 TaxID=2826582 RepID=A0A8S5NKH1_9CAUD|nr:MAG TPA: hypothetical protein [Podoviridae sp. ctsNK10]DAT92370.1 MAG TPA: hypothetical protein [Caudoviricetes sp.]
MILMEILRIWLQINRPSFLNLCLNFMRLLCSLKIYQYFQKILKNRMKYFRLYRQ